jgi:FAD/FMN-containing dehydrogenase
MEAAMTWTHGSIDGGETVDHTDDGDIHITGKIDGGSKATLTSTGGSIIIDGKVDGGSTANLTAPVGVIRIGFAGNADGEKKIDGGSVVVVRAGGDVSVGNKIDGASTVDLASNLGSITIGGKIDHNSLVTLTAAGNIRIGEAGNDGEQRKIDGNSHVNARAGGTIHLFNKIDGGSLSGDHSVVDFRACRGITIDDKVDGGSRVRLAVAPGSINDQNPPMIEIGDKIGGGGTQVEFWPDGSLHVENGIDSGGSATAVDWAGPLEFCNAGPSGYYWRNWPQTFGYVTDGRIYPQSLHELVGAVSTATRPTKAVGGGWSFSDAALPFRTQPEIDRISILKRGADGAEDFSHVLQGLNGITNSPVDLQPENVDGDLPLSTHYDQTHLKERVDSGANLPFAENVNIIDIRGLASSLQSRLHFILSESARKATEPGPGGAPPSKYYFHVEAGITMADLDQLLDHQSPRLAIQASGGSPGATLAGTLSTATHGGEFQWPLLVDRVRAIHLVGAGGEEWWIEGDTSIANHHRLQQVYPNIDHQHFIGGHWHKDGLIAQDVLNAVIVSMGTMGVIYSVVLEVVPQYGLQQIVTTFQSTQTPTGWYELLQKADTSEAELRSGSASANNRVLEVLLDGALNGTGISKADNVYCDLAINPFNQDCWITNRRVTPELPVDPNNSAVGFADYRSSLFAALGRPHAQDSVGKSWPIGRIFDFLGWATDVTDPGNPDDIINDANQGMRLASFITSYPDVMVSALATINVQAVANTANASDHPDRGQQFLGDMLTGFLNALQGTNRRYLNKNSDTTDIAYKVGAIGWPATGIPGRGIEIALPPTSAFTFLQTVLFDDVLTNTMVGANKPLIGYISIRICPPTNTLMGMQQFSPFSVMLEVVGYRSPEGNVVMDLIQQKVLEPLQVNAMLHWGLENDQLTGSELERMPVTQGVRAGSPFTRLSAFKQVRQLLLNGHAPSPFENRFVTRLNL